MLIANFRLMAMMSLALCVILGSSCSRSEPGKSSVGEASVEASNVPPSTPAKGTQPEPRSAETQSVEPQVQSRIEKLEAEKRASLLMDAQAALEETHNALAALDHGDKASALSALERASGKLDLVVSRDPKLAFAPINVTTTIFDVYATPDTVKRVVQESKDLLSREQVQQARYKIINLASEGEMHVLEIPVASYPAAIKAVAPLIDGGKTEEAKAALEAALNTLVVETFLIPLPPVRAEALLQQAEQLSSKASRTSDDNQRLHNLLNDTRTQIQLAEALGYGTKDDYKPLYAQLDDLQKKAESEQSNKSLFNRIEDSIKRFKFST